LRRTTILVCSALVACAAARSEASTGKAGDFVNVAGHRMYYRCDGSASPTVVLDAGSPDTSSTWRWVEPRIAGFARVCVYDRAGLGRSAPAPAGRHRTAITQVDELHALLARARIPGRYVVVGHSWGGLLARLFASRFPRAVAGVVLVDATTFPYLTPAAATRLPRKKNAEGIDLAAAVAESASIKSLRSVPLVVLGAGKPSPDPKLLEAQDQEAALSNDSVDAVATTSTHYVQDPPPKGQPDVVVAAVRAVVTSARTGRRLPSCRALFHGSGVRCRR
jgi:pimeloyl-ACP methyl ester carboxylesterase